MPATRLAILTLSVITLATPAAAQNDIGFAPIKPHRITVEPFADNQVEDLLATLTRLVGAIKNEAKWVDEANIHFWRLMNRLQTGLVSPAQEAMVLARFDALEKAHPTAKAFLDKQRELVRTRLIGKVAPEIAGKDLDNVEFKLSEYRGKVVVLYFTGQWCGPCRGEYPYQRLMLELHKDKPFAILGVNSDDTLDVARQAKADNRLEYRTWWDGYLEKKTSGPIASAWDVTGWPTIYLIDKKGVIRFVNLRFEDVLKGASQLLQEK